MAGFLGAVFCSSDLGREKVGDKKNQKIWKRWIWARFGNLTNMETFERSWVEDLGAWSGRGWSGPLHRRMDGKILQRRAYMVKSYTREHVYCQILQRRADGKILHRRTNGQSILFIVQVDGNLIQLMTSSAACRWPRTWWSPLTSPDSPRCAQLGCTHCEGGGESGPRLGKKPNALTTNTSKYLTHHKVLYTEAHCLVMRFARWRYFSLSSFLSIVDFPHLSPVWDVVEFRLTVYSLTQVPHGLFIFRFSQILFKKANGRI